MITAARIFSVVCVFVCVLCLNSVCVYGCLSVCGCVSRCCTKSILMQTDMIQYLRKIINNKGEGVMLRKPNSIYDIGKSRSLLKLKVSILLVLMQLLALLLMLLLLILLLLLLIFAVVLLLLLLLLILWLLLLLLSC